MHWEGGRYRDELRRIGAPGTWQTRGGSYSDRRQDAYGGPGRPPGRECLTDDERIDASNFEVAVQNGEVTLSGCFKSRTERRRAEDISARLAGVEDVHNRLRSVNDEGPIAVNDEGPIGVGG